MDSEQMIGAHPTNLALIAGLCAETRQLILKGVS